VQSSAPSAAQKPKLQHSGAAGNKFTGETFGFRLFYLCLPNRGCGNSLRDAVRFQSFFHITTILLEIMCRSIKTLFNFDPPATTDEVRAASLQFVRKLSGFSKPSRSNEEAFDLAIERVAAAAQEMLNSLMTNAPPRDRKAEAAKAKERAIRRFGTDERGGV